MTSRDSDESDEASSSADASAARKQNVLGEIYWYVIRDQGVYPNDLNVGHVVASLQDEGILFWRDYRFRESQNVALSLCGKARGRFSDKISLQDSRVASDVVLSYNDFVDLVRPCASLFLRSFSEGLVIQDWSTFIADMTHHFNEVEPITDGKNADYIPVLKNAESEKWGLSICSTDGQRFSIGDVDAKHTLQSTSKPVTYALSLKREGSEYVDQWIGVEPAGRPFNTQDLDPDTHKPYNSSVNSGAIMASGIYASVYPDLSWKEIVDRVRETWYDMCGNDLEIGFSAETYESEKSTAYNNFAIAYNLKGRRGLPRDVDLIKMLDVYLGCCSIEITAEALAVAAATLANGGVCPITAKEVFPAHVVRQVLSETMTCGMYDQSGNFAVEVGLPAKSGVSGALLVIVPNVFGFATFSPRLNARGNSVRGVEFCKRLVSSHRVHTFEPLRSGSRGAKIDPRKNGLNTEKVNTYRVAWALRVGDAFALRLRDIFLFALCRVAYASKSGLSDATVEIIRDKYEMTYQAHVEESHLQEVITTVKQHPGTLRFLEDLIGGIVVPDELRSMILMGMADVLTLNCRIEDTESTVATKVCVLLGIDEDVARMQLARFADRCGHRFKGASPLNPLVATWDSQIYMAHVQEESNDEMKRIKAHKQGLTEVAYQEIQGNNENRLLEENKNLRLEVYELKLKIDRLTALLNSRDQTID